MKRTLAVLLMALPLAACETSDGGGTATNLPAFGTADDLADMVGARAGQGELGLQSKGYALARTQGLTAFWWNANTRACARIVTAQGRYESIATASPSDCGQSQAGAAQLPAGAPTPAESACLRDVAKTTGNANVRVISSAFSQAGTEVNVAVGPTGTWRCIAYSDGTTAGIESTTDEGSL